jgi:hypothetical protein
MQVHAKHHGKDQGMTRVKVITDKHNQGCILDKTCEASKKGKQFNGEVGEVLSPNSDEKEEALKGRLEVGMWQGHRYHEGLKVIMGKDVEEEVNGYKNQGYKYQRGWS